MTSILDRLVGDVIPAYKKKTPQQSAIDSKKTAPSVSTKSKFAPNYVRLPSVNKTTTLGMKFGDNNVTPKVAPSSVVNSGTSYRGVSNQPPVQPKPVEQPVVQNRPPVSPAKLPETERKETPVFEGLIKTLTGQSRRPTPSEDPRVRLKSGAVSPFNPKALEILAQQSEQATTDYGAAVNDLVARGLPLTYGTAAKNALAQQAQEQQTRIAEQQSTALAARGQGLQALQQAAQLSQPVQVAMGSTLVSPLSGETIAGGIGGGYLGYKAVEQVQGLTNQYPDARDASGRPFNYDQSQTPEQNLERLKTQYLPNSPSYQSSTYGALGASSPSQAAQIQASQANYQQFAKQEAEVQTASQRADALALNLIGVLEKYTAGQTAKPINKVINEIRGTFGDAEASAFETALTEAQRAYQTLITTAGSSTPTNAGEAMSTILDKSATPAQIIAALEQLALAGEISLGAIRNQKDSALSGISSVSSGQFSNEEQSSAGGFNFRFINGKWVAQ